MNYMPVVMGDRHGGAGRAPVVNSVAEGLWVHNMANTTVGIAASVAARRENPRYPSNLAWESRLAVQFRLCMADACGPCQSASRETGDGAFRPTVNRSRSPFQGSGLGFRSVESPLRSPPRVAPMPPRKRSCRDLRPQ